MSAVMSTQGRLPSFAEERFERWWDMNGEWVEAPNLRRGGESGVKRLLARGRPPLYSKRQLDHTYRSLLHPFGWPTALREDAALRDCRRLGVPVPEVVFCAARRHQRRWQALLITEELQGYRSLDQWYADGPDEDARRAMLRQLAQVLQRLHGGRRQHGCLYAKHIYLRGDGEQIQVALLDLEKSRRRLLRQRAVRHDLRQLERHRGGMPDSDWTFLLACYYSVADGN